MIQPPELKLLAPMEVANGVQSTTHKVWDILYASYKGDMDTVHELVEECPELIYAQYNYTPPIHFAVREGHAPLVKYLLTHGALAPDYKIYPFQESLLTIANDRRYYEIAWMLEDYLEHPERCRYTKDTGAIQYPFTSLQLELQKAVDKEDLATTEKLLKTHPGLAEYEFYFWGEGILTFAAKHYNRAMVDLLLQYGAKIPAILKWGQFYYFERLDGAAYMMEKGMDPNTQSWHGVTLLHDMAQKGYMEKAELLIRNGADLNRIDEEYQSTPLGMAARWGHTEMVKYLLQCGADPGLGGRVWSAPLAWATSKGHDDIERMLHHALP